MSWDGSTSASEALQERTAKLKEQTEKFERVGELTYALLPEEDPEAIIVFFHGLLLDESEKDHAFWSTWTKRGTLDECWPVTMLPQYLAKNSKSKNSDPYRIRVLAVSYEGRTSVPEVGNRHTDQYNLTENLISDLLLNDLCQGPTKPLQTNEVPVFLVGHDLGGILIKNFVLAVENKLALEAEDDVKDKLENFLDNLKAVFFYSTPNNGSTAIENLVKAKNIPAGEENQMLKLMSVLDKNMSRINGDFRNYRSGQAHGLRLPRFKSYAIVPQFLTNQKGFTKTMVVEEGSARNDMDSYFSVQADHFQACQPVDTWSASLSQLGQKVLDVVSQVRTYERLKLVNTTYTENEKQKQPEQPLTERSLRK